MKARFEIIFSMAAFGTIAVFVRNIGLPSREVALYRAVIAALALLLWQLCTRQTVRWQDVKKELPLLFVSGAAMSVNWILLFEAYKYTTVAMATLSYYFAPVIVTVASTVLFREKLTAKQISCFVMSTLGLVMVIGVSGGGGSHDLFGILLGLGAAVFYASVVLINKGIRHVSGLNRTFMQFLAAILVMTPYISMTGGSHLGSLDINGAVNLMVVGVFHTGICYCMYFSSLRYLKGQEASILSYIDPVVAVIISVAVLHEAVSPLQAAGGFMILGFTVLNEWDAGAARRS
ncbi:EamA/RhaT family transporter [Clostridiales bacterium TF09-2AC]|uniref:DMT family transporter n=1 Tax=Enterocloster hominis (ex Hitch et al. 2024) TaxID=1917870 RepID=UPI000E70EB3E|nr:DMT family transporter [Lachnoclostridium pacaense]MCC2820478.1 DMT family transporter [Lachnoclostridium pacaense]RJW33853.1 EamA/RhaT family transporter [Clostridiales bacterium TF09-2AC]